MPDNDHGLVERCLRGEQDAFGLLYDRHAPRVHRMLVRLSGNTTSAEDLTQETFVTAYRSLGAWRRQGAFSSWLCGIAVRLYRKSMRRPQLLETELLDDICIDRNAGSDPLDYLEQRELERLLEGAIQALPDLYREVFVLLRVEGMSQRETADLLETPIGTVQSRLWRAVCLLRKSLNEQGLESGTGRKDDVEGGRNALRNRP